MTITTNRIQLLSRLLDVAALRQDVIAQNVANLNTPGYSAMEVSFEDALKQALAPGSDKSVRAVVPEIQPGGGGLERADGNNVDVDLEMARLQKNAIYFQVYSQMLANDLAQFRSAIKGQQVAHNAKEASMAFDDLLISGNISASGMTAERMRMEVIANNVANAQSTRTANGGPYRRQDVLFETIMHDQLQGSPTPSMLGGVRVVGIQDDPSELPRVHDPGHPDADSEGFVTMPNVFLPIEMVNLMTASRAYEANLKVLQTLRQQLEQTLTLLKY